MDFDGKLHVRGGMNMLKYPDEIPGPVLKAAKIALETGNVNYILIWVPENSENTVKNLLENTCCIRSSKTHLSQLAYDWYFEMVNRFYQSSKSPDYDTNQFQSSAGKLFLKIENAIESGNFEEIRDMIPVSHEADAQQRFLQVMNLRDYPVNNITAGRSYVSAFFDFNRYVHNLSSGVISRKDQ
jgi:hypothetical protein